MLRWGQKSGVTDTDAKFAHLTEATLSYDNVLSGLINAGVSDRYQIIAAIEAERNHLRAENVELRRQVAELNGRLAAMEAK